MAEGNLEKGFEYYERRLSKGSSGRILYTLKIDPWDGLSSLKGKSILIGSEQGVGDELLFSAYFLKG